MYTVQGQLLKRQRQAVHAKCASSWGNHQDDEQAFDPAAIQLAEEFLRRVKKPRQSTMVTPNVSLSSARDDPETLPSIIELNVGGHFFATSLATLRSHPDSMLARMFAGIHMLQKDVNGRFFIDRDGKNFGIILNYLRHSHLVADVQDPVLREELVQEADFYGLDGMRDALCGRPVDLATSTRTCFSATLCVNETRREWLWQQQQLTGASSPPSGPATEVEAGGEADDVVLNSGACALPFGQQWVVQNPGNYLVLVSLDMEAQPAHQECVTLEVDGVRVAATWEWNYNATAEGMLPRSLPPLTLRHRSPGLAPRRLVLASNHAPHA